MILLKNAYLAGASELAAGNFCRADLAIDGGKIAAVGDLAGLLNNSNARVIDCSNILLLPGFYNAHCHLDFSAALLELGDFARWHSSIFSAPQPSQEDTQLLIAARINELIRSGVSHIGDISSSGAALLQLANSGLQGVVYAELLGANGAVAPARLAALKERVEVIKALGLAPGVALHSGYSLTPALAFAGAEFAAENDLPLSMHWAESAYEKQLFAGEFNALASSLVRFSPDELIGAQLWPLAKHLRERVQLVHCCYEEDFEALSGFLEVVRCLRSNVLLGCKKCRYEGANLTIGTDGMSSNYSLNFLDELRANLFAYGGSGADLAIFARRLLSAAIKRPGGGVGLLKAGERADLAALFVRPGTPAEQLALRAILENHSAAFSVLGGQIIGDLAAFGGCK